MGGLDIIIYMVYIVHENTETAVGSENHLLKLKGKTKKNRHLAYTVDENTKIINTYWFRKSSAGITGIMIYQ